MSALLRHPALIVAAAILLFAGWCRLHAFAADHVLAWRDPLIWGLIAGGPAGLLVHALRAWRERIGGPVATWRGIVAVFAAALVWGMAARGAIGPGHFPDARTLMLQLFPVLPVAAALAGLAALILQRAAAPPSPLSPWIELPEAPLLRLRAADLDWVSAAGNYCEFHTGDRVHLVRLPMARAAERLGPHGFLRAHRSAIVNLAALATVEPGTASGGTRARLRNGALVPVGRSFQDALLASLSRSSHG